MMDLFCGLMQWIQTVTESKTPGMKVELFHFGLINQTAIKMPFNLFQVHHQFMQSVFDAYPAIRFASGDSFNVGSLNLNVGNIHVFMVSGNGGWNQASNGITGWTLDAKQSPRLSSYSNEYNVLQQLTLGVDPSTGFGQLIGEIGEF